MRTLAFGFFVLFISSFTRAQIGGHQVYKFLDLPATARSTALGEMPIAFSDEDGGLARHNPATLQVQADGQLSLSYDFFLSDISRGGISYASHSKKWNTSFHGNIQYIDYGTFLRTNEIGIVEGEFEAGESALTLGASHALYERLRLGINATVINAHYDGYSSWGMAFDLAALYHQVENEVVFTLVARNIGFQFSSFHENREDLPFDLQLGYSRRLKYLPFKYSIVAHHLHRWDVTYDDPNNQTGGIFGQGNERNENTFIENFFRHLIFSGEMYIGEKENLTLRLAYNHLRGKELQLTDFRTFSGFSFGIGLKLGKLYLDYGFGQYHTQASVSHLTLRTGLYRLFGADREI